MIVAESHRGRRLVAQLDRGADVLEAAAALCRARGVRSGVISAFGTVDEAEVREFDTHSRAVHAPRRFSGWFTIVHLGGHISERGGGAHLEMACALARESDNGVELVGGRLTRARAYAVQLVIECFDDLVVRSAVEAATGLTLWSEAIEASRSAPEGADRGPVAAAAAARPGTPPVTSSATSVSPSTSPPPAPRFEAGPSGHVVPRAAMATPRSTDSSSVTGSSAGASEGGLTWAEVAARSAAQGPIGRALDGEDGEDGDDAIRAGDVIDHPRFGHCEVERLEGGGEYAQVRLRNRRLVRLSLDVIQLVRDGRSEEGRRRFRAKVST